jgi:methionyl-tRNA formyltransferase
MKIIFMGTPEFAVESLAILVEAGHQIVAVVTVPDKPSGRGLQVVASPVKQYALSKNIPVLQPEKLKNPDFLNELSSYQADLQIVVAFRMLPELVWNMPRLGTFNLHASLLPQYRGAAPINWAIINGETQTGLSTFFLEHEIDTGQLIFQETEDISDTDDVGQLYERMKQKGGQLVLKTVLAIQAGQYPQIPQPLVQDLKLAPKIHKETCQIDWEKTSQEIYNFVRGLSPYPAAWTSLNGKTLKIFETLQSEVPEHLEEISQGIFSDRKKCLYFKTKDGFLATTKLQLEGKKRMDVDEFLRGYRL